MAMAQLPTFHDDQDAITMAPEPQPEEEVMNEEVYNPPISSESTMRMEDDTSHLVSETEVSGSQRVSLTSDSSSDEGMKGNPSSSSSKGNPHPISTSEPSASRVRPRADSPELAERNVASKSSDSQEKEETIEDSSMMGHREKWARDDIKTRKGLARHFSLFPNKVIDQAFMSEHDSQGRFFSEHSPIKGPIHEYEIVKDALHKRGWKMEKHDTPQECHQPGLYTDYCLGHTTEIWKKVALFPVDPATETLPYGKFTHEDANFDFEKFEIDRESFIREEHRLCFHCLYHMLKNNCESIQKNSMPCYVNPNCMVWLKGQRENYTANASTPRSRIQFGCSKRVLDDNMRGDGKPMLNITLLKRFCEQVSESFACAMNP